MSAQQSNAAFFRMRNSLTLFQDTYMAQSSSDRSTSRITPFTVHIADDNLQHLGALLRMTPIAQPTYETSLPGGDRSFGMRQDWLKQAVWEWKNTFDW
jgi:hypothetical protein